MSEQNEVERLRKRIESIVEVWVGRQDLPMPKGLDEWGPECPTCGSSEFRIDGFCSSEHRDWYEFGLELRAALNGDEK